jgi:hypothetical protein
VQEVGSQPDFRVTFARMATRLLREMSRRHRIKDWAERALSVVKALSVAVPSGVQLKLEVEAVSEIVKDSLARSFFGTRLQMATDTEQRYLAAMAGAGRAPYRSADVAHRFGVKDQRGVSVHRESLIQKGLIWSPRRGQLDFTVPLFAEYLTENHPLETFEESA